jgi:glycosyltransferase involved in cell wall biosynthesis
MTKNGRAPRVWLVNPFDPVPGSGLRPMRYAGFAEAFAAAGWEVLWLTADFDHLTRRRRPAPEPIRAVRIEYVHVPPYRGTFSLARVRSHRRYAQALRRHLLMPGLEPPDAIVASLPLLGALRAALAYRTARRCAVIADVQDLWPEAAGVALPRALRAAYRPVCAWLAHREARALRVCDGVVGVSETYLAARAPAGPPRLCAYLGVDLAAFDQALAAAGEGRHEGNLAAGESLAVLWAGSLRPAADLPTAIEAVKRAQRRGVRVRLVVAGDGPSRGACEALAAHAGLGAAVRFTGAYDLDGLARLLRQSDVGLNAYVAGAANSLTNKLFDYQAAGLAILNSVPGEVAALVADHGMGLNYEPGRPESLAAAMAALAHDPARTAAMGRAARRFAEHHGSRTAIARRVVDFVTALQRAHDGGPSC